MKLGLFVLMAVFTMGNGAQARNSKFYVLDLTGKNFANDQFNMLSVYSEGT